METTCINKVILSYVGNSEKGIKMLRAIPLGWRGLFHFPRVFPMGSAIFYHFFRGAQGQKLVTDHIFFTVEAWGSLQLSGV